MVIHNRQVAFVFPYAQLPPPFVEVGFKGLDNEMAPSSYVLPILHQTNHMDHPTIQGAINKYHVGPYTT